MALHARLAKSCSKLIKSVTFVRKGKFARIWWMGDKREKDFTLYVFFSFLNMTVLPILNAKYYDFGKGS